MRRSPGRVQVQESVRDESIVRFDDLPRGPTLGSGRLFVSAALSRSLALGKNSWVSPFSNPKPSGSPVVDGYTEHEDKGYFSFRPLDWH